MKSYIVFLLFGTTKSFKHQTHFQQNLLLIDI